ncbi:MAG TPA: hypothetical protein VFC02_02260 [Anaerolineales bacterium]|nr:hypothetical protein [Anaerolineales bacterium]
MKTISLFWTALVGLLTIVGQVIWFFLRFGAWNAEATPGEFFIFFLAGGLGGWLLIAFLNRQASMRQRWAVLVAFLIASPVALFVMILGGLFGPLGVLGAPLIPWGLAAWIGSLAGKLITRT